MLSLIWRDEWEIESELSHTTCGKESRESEGSGPQIIPNCDFKFARYRRF